MSRTATLRRPALVALAAAALLAACGTTEDPEPAGDGTTAAAEQRTPTTGTTGHVTVTESSVVLGDPEAPERIHVYQDLNCPHCRELHDLMEPDVATWSEGGDVAVELTVVDYLGPRTTHGFSTRGANILAVVADADPEAWPAVQQALLDMQPASTTEEVTDERLITAARDAGADLDDAAVAAVGQLAYADWVSAATADAAAAGVNYIPQVWVDGELISGETHAQTVALVRQAVTD